MEDCSISIANALEIQQSFIKPSKCGAVPKVISLRSFIMYITLCHQKGDHSQISHDEVIKWKRFPRYWPFVRGIHGSPFSWHFFMVLNTEHINVYCECAFSILPVTYVCVMGCMLCFVCAEIYVICPHANECETYWGIRVGLRLFLWNYVLFWYRLYPMRMLRSSSKVKIILPIWPATTYYDGKITSEKI